MRPGGDRCYFSAFAELMPQSQGGKPSLLYWVTRIGGIETDVLFATVEGVCFWSRLSCCT